MEKRLLPKNGPILEEARYIFGFELMGAEKVCEYLQEPSYCCKNKNWWRWVLMLFHCEIHLQKVPVKFRQWESINHGLKNIPKERRYKNSRQTYICTYLKEKEQAIVFHLMITQFPTKSRVTRINLSYWELILKLFHRLISFLSRRLSRRPARKERKIDWVKEKQTEVNACSR